MNLVIGILIAVVMTVATLTQRGEIPRTPGYLIAGVLAVITFGVAIARYNRRKAAGE